MGNAVTLCNNNVGGMRTTPINRVFDAGKESVATELPYN